MIQVENIDDVSGEPLIKRADDNEEEEEIVETQRASPRWKKTGLQRARPMATPHITAAGRPTPKPTSSGKTWRTRRGEGHGATRSSSQNEVRASSVKPNRRRSLIGTPQDPRPQDGSKASNTWTNNARGNGPNMGSELEEGYP